MASLIGGDMSMFVKFILPALTEAKSPLFRPIKYSLFPPLGLAGLAAIGAARHAADASDFGMDPQKFWNAEPGEGEADGVPVAD